MAVPTLLPVAPTMAVLATMYVPLATMCVPLASLMSRLRLTPQMLVIATTDVDIIASANVEPQYKLCLPHQQVREQRQTKHYHHCNGRAKA